MTAVKVSILNAQSAVSAPEFTQRNNPILKGMPPERKCHSAIQERMAEMTSKSEVK